MAYDQNAAARLRALLLKGGATNDRACPKGMHRAFVGTRSETCVPDAAPQPVTTGESWFSRFIGSIGQPTSAVPSLYPLLKAPSPEARLTLRQHLMMAARARRGAPAARKVVQPTRKRVAQPKPPTSSPGWTPNAPGGPATTMPEPAASAAPPQEVDVTPAAPAPAPEQPTYDGFHGHAPSFSGPQEEFGDLEADLGLAD